MCFRAISRLFILPMGVAFGIGCASSPPKPPPAGLDPEGALLCVKVKVHPPVDVGSQASRTVAFARLEEGQEIWAASEWIQSNFEDQGSVFLVGARPGTYVAVACFNHGSLLSAPLYYTFLNEESIRVTKVTVPPHGVAFMGEFLVDGHSRWTGSDRAQDHYRDLLGPEDSIAQRGTVDTCHRDLQTEAQLLRSSLERFESTSWHALIQSRLDEIEQFPTTPSRAESRE